MSHDDLWTWEERKERRKQQAEDFMRAECHPEDVRWIIATIKRRLSNDCSDEEWAQFMSILEANKGR